MIKGIQVFNYEDTQVRTYTDETGEVWLVAKDVCKVLGIQNHKDAIKCLDEDEKSGVEITDPHGRVQMTNVINEPGLYKLTFRSRKPNAKFFTRWVTHEVLPSIRQTGSYTSPRAERVEEELQEPLNIRVRIAGILQRLALQVSDERMKEYLNRESYRYATGETLPESEAKPQEKPQYWTAEQVGAILNWPSDAVMYRAERLGLTRKAKNGYWDGDTWNFSREGRQNFLQLVRAGVVKIEGGYEYYENGFKRLHWEFDANAARV